jgi:hypothetical protein
VRLYAADDGVNAATLREPFDDILGAHDILGGSSTLDGVPSRGTKEGLLVPALAGGVSSRASMVG